MRRQRLALVVLLSLSACQSARPNEPAPDISTSSPIAPPPRATSTRPPAASPTPHVLSVSQAQTAVALGTHWTALTIGTETPLPLVIPTAPPGLRYFEIPSGDADIRRLVLYDPTIWRLVTGPEAAELQIEGDAGLAHWYVPNCEIYDSVGRGFEGVTSEEHREVGDEIFLVRSFFTYEGLLLFIVYDPAQIHLEVPTDGWSECKTAAELVLTTFTYLAPTP